MTTPDASNRSPLGLIVTVLLVIVLPLGLGLFLASRFVPAPKIGIVRLTADINDFTTAEVTEQLRLARQAPDVKAVVLIINSPGGSAAYSEELFLEVLNTRKDLPVIASIDLLGASGAYYMAAGADEIYAKAGSFVGSIGVIASLPGPVFLEEEVLTTGPYKSFGGTRDAFTRQAEQLKFAFLEAVRVGRGERLTVDLDTLSRAEIYTGLQALEFGLIDGLGSTDDIVQRAGELAGLVDYEVEEMYPRYLEAVAGVSVAGYQPPAVDVNQLWAAPEGLPAGLYFRYLDLPGRP